jgi:Secretion system C-terminal sorting domain
MKAMKNILRICLMAALLCPAALSAQIHNLFVETYYVSDAADATDSTNYIADPNYPMASLPSGSKTYRVYIELEPGSRLKKIYGDVNHALKISSTQNFYNNIDRPNAYFGYSINKSWFSSNPTIALDSWLTLGLGERTNSGTLKVKDNDGSLLSGTGLLTNNDASAGIPITTADGFTPSGLASPVWSDYGFRDNISGGTDTTVFGSVNNGAQFISNDAYLMQNSGVVGASADSEKVLVAQLTTLGDISFELNVVLIEQDISGPVEVSYVARLANGETNSNTLKVSPYLTYPPVCGCTDPNFLEYNAAYACNNSDSCHTLIRFGCMDSSACNYDVNANFNIPSLCCYPGYCNDRDIAVVCPSLNDPFKNLNLYPNPAHDVLTLHISPDNEKEVKYLIYNAVGELVQEKNLGVISGTYLLDISELDNGLHLFRIFTGDASVSKMFLKK